LPVLIGVLVATMVTIGTVGDSLSAAERPRLLVLTDIGGDPDDQQSMIRLMPHPNSNTKDSRNNDAVLTL